MRIKILALAMTAAMAGPAYAGDILFTSAPVPTTDNEKRSILTPEFAYVDGEKTAVEYHTLLRSGDMPSGSGAPFGLFKT